MPVAALSTTAVVLVVAIVIVEIALAVVCIVDLVRRPAAGVTFGTKVPWYVIVLLLGFIGPIVYLAAGRRDVPMQDDDAPVQPQDAPARDRAERTVDLLYGQDKDD